MDGGAVVSIWAADDTEDHGEEPATEAELAALHAANVEEHKPAQPCGWTVADDGSVKSVPPPCDGVQKRARVTVDPEDAVAPRRQRGRGRGKS